MNKRFYETIVWMTCCLPVVAMTLLTAACSDNGSSTSNTLFNPKEDVTITEFSPDSGSVRTKMFIYGKNFGTDKTKITVTIGDKSANVIGSDGECVYCMIPSRCDGPVAVSVTDGVTTKTATSANAFKYIFKPVVRTLIRNVDQYGKSSMKDGPFEEAGLVNPYWLTIDPKDPSKLFYLEWGTNVRLIDLKNKTVSTCIPSGAGGMNRPSSACWTKSGDTLLISNGSGTEKENSIAVMYLTRASQFKTVRTLATTIMCNSVAVNPVDGEIFYMSGSNSRVFRYNRKTQSGDLIGSFRVLGPNFRMFFHPSGKWMYLFDEYHGYIAKSFYDFKTKTLEPPIFFAGNFSQQGYQDGVGTDIRFSWGYQGVFVKNPQYVREGREDVYDFYITDSGNDCIRILTPDARMTTFAGRGSTSLDGSSKGFVDGDLRKEARFNWPDGIYYDDVNNIFYIADYYNHALRYINMSE